MKKEYKIAGALLVAGILGYVAFRTASSQADNQRQLDELRHRLDAASQGATQPADTGPRTVVIGPATGAGGALQHQQAIDDVNRQGQRMLASGTAKDAATAAEIYREGLKIDPQNADFYNGLGRAQLVLGTYGDALKTFQDGHQIDKTNVMVVSGAGWALWDLKDFYHAKLVWENAIQLDGKCIDAWMIMSWVYLALGEQQKAEDGFRMLVDSPTGKDHAEWVTGHALARAGNFRLDVIRAQCQWGMPDPSAFSAAATKAATPVGTPGAASAP